MLHRLLGILVIGGSLIAGWLWIDFDDFLNRPLEVPADGIRYVVAPGTSMAQLATDLETKKIISNGLYLRLLARWRKLAHRLQAGEYFLRPGTTPVDFLQLLVTGKVTNYAVTLVEGWTFQQILQALRLQEELVHDLNELTNEEIMIRLGHPGEHPEGRFFPETYFFPRGMSESNLLRRAYDALAARLASEWENRAQDLPLETPYEALILASIVERETGQPDERAAIAGVFVRRLEMNMKLQTDPTVIYGMGEQYDGNIRRRDLSEDTPYNTYVHKGLPPTPISMPGGAAIHATLHPAEGKSLYFVARGDGSHQFSDTLEEHNKAVRKYQLKR